MQKIEILDSHTGGEPTRLILAGGPDLGHGSMAERRELLRQHHDYFRSAVINEPHGSDIIVGALLCEPVDQSAVAGVIFFDNAAYLGMCGHGTIGVITSLAYLGKIQPGVHRLETPAGPVTARLHEDGRVTVHNLPAYRFAKRVAVEVEGYGTLQGDIAWGGNWFYLIEDHGQTISFERVDQLTDFCWRVRQALEKAGIYGAEGALIEHVILYGPSTKGANSQNFVLCPGKAYDRSPCGTGTSAKLACLAADDQLAPGEIWVQESIVGSCFEASYQLEDGQVWPNITGSANITLQGQLILDERDPFRWGINYEASL